MLGWGWRGSCVKFDGIVPGHRAVLSRVFPRIAEPNRRRFFSQFVVVVIVIVSRRTAKFFRSFTKLSFDKMNKGVTGLL